MFLKDLSYLRNFKKIYIFDILNEKTKKFIFNRKEKNALIIFRQNSINESDLNFLNKNKIEYKIFSWQFFNKNIFLMWISHKLSLNESDNLYKFFLKKNSIQINYLINLYKEKKIEKACKKFLVDAGQDYYDLKTIIRVLLRYNKNITCHIFKESNCILKDFDKKNSKITDLIFPNREKSFSLKKTIILILYPIITSFFCNKFKFNIVKKKFKVAFRIYSNGFTFDKNGSLDWIIEDDKKLINQSLFVLEDNLKKNNYDKFKGLINTNYNFCNSNLRLQSNINLKLIYKNLIIFFKSFFVKLQLIFKREKLIFDFFFEGYTNYFIWNNFCQNYKIENYVSFHNYQFTHYFRNIILNKHNCKTIHYKATNSENVFNSKIIKSYNNARMVFFNYDIEHHQTLQSLMMSKQNQSISKKFIISGPTFVSKNKKIHHDIFDNSKFKILMFNSTYNSYTSCNGFDTHYKFLKLAEKLLNDERYIIYFKSKKNFETYYSLENEIKTLAKNIYNKKNFIVLENIYPNNLIIEKSDLTISMPFASPLIYSIFKKRNLLFCDLNDQYPNSFFKDYENIFTNNEKQAIELVNLYYLNMINKDSYNKLFFNCFGETSLQEPKNIIKSNFN